MCLHTDNLNISSVNKNEATKVIWWLESEYGEMHGSCEKRHNYLRMWLDYSVPGEVRISMGKHLREVLDSFLEEITEIPETPSTANLLTVREKN